MAERPLPSSKPIAQKLLLKPGARVAILDAPAGYVASQLGGVAADEQPGGGTYDFVQVFATRSDDLVERARAIRDHLTTTSIVWFSYPKGKALATDLNRDRVRELLLPIGLDTVSQVAIDEVWSALRVKMTVGSTMSR